MPEGAAEALGVVTTVAANDGNEASNEASSPAATIKFLMNLMVLPPVRCKSVAKSITRPMGPSIQRDAGAHRPISDAIPECYNRQTHRNDLGQCSKH